LGGHFAAGGGAGLGKRRERGRKGEVEGREREGPKLLLNQGPSEPCYATGHRGSSILLNKVRCRFNVNLVSQVVDQYSINCAKLQSYRHHQQTNTQLFTGRMHTLSHTLRFNGHFSRLDALPEKWSLND